jgi:hypothetical protein
MMVFPVRIEHSMWRFNALMTPMRANPISSIAQVDGSRTARTSSLASVVVSVCVALILVD